MRLYVWGPKLEEAGLLQTEWLQRKQVGPVVGIDPPQGLPSPKTINFMGLLWTKGSILQEGSLALADPSQWRRVRTVTEVGVIAGTLPLTLTATIFQHVGCEVAEPLLRDDRLSAAPQSKQGNLIQKATAVFSTGCRNFNRTLYNVKFSFWVFTQQSLFVMPRANGGDKVTSASVVHIVSSHRSKRQVGIARWNHLGVIHCSRRNKTVSQHFILHSFQQKRLSKHAQNMFPTFGDKLAIFLLLAGCMERLWVALHPVPTNQNKNWDLPLSLATRQPRALPIVNTLIMNWPPPPHPLISSYISSSLPVQFPSPEAGRGKCSMLKQRFSLALTKLKSFSRAVGNSWFFTFCNFENWQSLKNIFAPHLSKTTTSPQSIDDKCAYLQRTDA